MLLEYTLDHTEKIFGEVPIYKYLAAANPKYLIKYKERIEKYSSVNSFKNKSERNRTKTNKWSSKDVLSSSYNTYHKLNNMLGVDEDKLEIEDIYSLLVSIFNECPGILKNKPLPSECKMHDLLNSDKTPKPIVKTNIRKLTKIYDFLKYKK